MHRNVSFCNHNIDSMADMTNIKLLRNSDKVSKNMMLLLLLPLGLRILCILHCFLHFSLFSFFIYFLIDFEWVATRVFRLWACSCIDGRLLWLCTRMHVAWVNHAHMRILENSIWISSVRTHVCDEPVSQWTTAHQRWIYQNRHKNIAQIVLCNGIRSRFVIFMRKSVAVIIVDRF